MPQRLFFPFAGCCLLLLLAATAVSRAGGNNNAYLPLIVNPISLEPSDNLQVLSATYLGGTGADTATAVDIAPDNTVVLGGRMPGYNPGGVTPTPLLGGGDGVVVRLSEDAQTVLSVTRIGDAVLDLEVGADGRIVVCGSFGLALLTADASAVAWHQGGLGEGVRCATGSDGLTAVLAGGEVHVFDGGGAALGSWDPGPNPADVAVDGATQHIIITGWKQASSNLQVPWLKAWPPGGTTPAWTAYDFSAGAVSGEGLGTDSRGRLVVMGRDGFLYFAGRTDGGNNVFNRSPQDVTVSLPDNLLIKTDRFNNPYQLSGSTNIGFYGRFDPATGEILKGQFMLTRLSNGNGNAIQAYGMMADGNGRLYIAGQAYASIENRSSRQINGIGVGPYSGGEPFLLIVSPDFTTRIIWTPFAGSNGAGGSPATGVSVRSGRATAVVGLRAGEDNLITVNPIQPQKGGDAEAYLAVWWQSGE